jgi:transposase
LLYPDNIGEHLSIDETAFTNGDLYTIVTNKSGKEKKGTLVAMVKGTKSDDVLNVLYKIPIESRSLVKEITLDLAGSMNLIAKKAFPYASKVIDRFHVQLYSKHKKQE